MINRVFFAMAGFVGLSLSLSGQQARGVEQLQLDGSTLDGLPLGWPSLSLEDRETFFFSTSFGWTQPRADFLPSFNPVQPRSVVHPNAPGRKNLDDNDNVVDLRSADRIHVGGEIGFLYGRSSGKYGVEYERGYVIGELGNDKFHLTVGTSYERSSGRVSRWGR
jgi:hypothetical protein